MGKTFQQIKDTIEVTLYKDSIEYFLQTNGADLSQETKEQIRKDPDRFILFGESENGLEISFKNPDDKTGGE